MKHYIYMVLYPLTQHVEAHAFTNSFEKEKESNNNFFFLF